MFNGHSPLPGACTVGGTLKGNWYNQENHGGQLQAILEGMPHRSNHIKGSHMPTGAMGRNEHQKQETP